MYLLFTTNCTMSHHFSHHRIFRYISIFTFHATRSSYLYLSLCFSTLSGHPSSSFTHTNPQTPMPMASDSGPKHPLPQLRQRGGLEDLGLSLLYLNESKMFDFLSWFSSILPLSGIFHSIGINIGVNISKKSAEIGMDKIETVFLVWQRKTTQACSNSAANVLECWMSRWKTCETNIYSYWNQISSNIRCKDCKEMIGLISLQNRTERKHTKPDLDKAVCFSLYRL